MLSLAMTIIMAMTMAKYLTTKNQVINGSTPWPPNTVLWPTIMLLSISATAFLLNFTIIIAYCWSVKAANTAASWSSVFTITFGLMRTGAWIVAAVLFRIGETGRDLWGWSCGGSDNISQDLQAVVNFNTICQTNVSLLPILRSCAQKL